MSRLEFFRTDQCHQEVAPQQKRDDETKDGFNHCAASQPITEHGVAGPKEEERAGKRQEDHVEHDGLP